MKYFISLHSLKEQPDFKAELKRFEEELLKIHPDAIEILKSVSFEDWRKCQWDYVNHAFFESSNPREAASIITRYKEYRKENEINDICDAQQDIIKGFIKLAKLSEGYRQHNEFESICTLFNRAYDRFMEIFHKKNPI